MDAAGVTVLSECERLGPIGTTLVVGKLSDDVHSRLPGRVSSMSAEELLEQDPALVVRHDLVVHIGDSNNTELARRALGWAFARMADRAVIAVHRLGADVPIPLIEVKRGVVLDEPSLAYRVYANSGVQQ